MLSEAHVAPNRFGRMFGSDLSHPRARDSEDGVSRLMFEIPELFVERMSEGSVDGRQPWRGPASCQFCHLHSGSPECQLSRQRCQEHLSPCSLPRRAVTLNQPLREQPGTCPYGHCLALPWQGPRSPASSSSSSPPPPLSLTLLEGDQQPGHGHAEG